MRRALTCRTGLLAASLACLVAPVQAQGTAGRATSAFTITGGVGGVFAGSQDGVDRNTGWALLGGVEFRQPRWTGFASRLALRVEGGFSSQGLSSASSFTGGDVQTVHGAALVSVALASEDGFESYALAGPVLSRSSTRFVFDAPTTQTPGSGFEQTTHETAAGALVGVGAGWRAGSAIVRVEARWMTLATTNTTTMVPVILSVAIPLHR